MLMRYGQAAVLAALATLMGNVAWAQQGCISGLAPADCCQKAKCCNDKGCCATGACCKDGKCCKNEGNYCIGCRFEIVESDGKCCKDGGCCCKGKKCDAKCTCCKDSKCECGKGGECCCGKSGKCCCTDKGACCCKDKSSIKATGCGCCPFLSKLAKGTAIIVVMPSSLPLLGACHVEAMGMLPHPPLPLGPQVVLPAPLPPPPPMLAPPGLPVMPPPTVAIPVPPPSCYTGPAPMPVLCAPTPDAAVTPSKANTQVETCLQLLDLVSELCSLVRPLNTPSMCASALELLMERMSPIAYAQAPAAYVTHPPQYIPPSPPFPAPREPNAQEANTGSLIFGIGVNSNSGLTGSIISSGSPAIVPCGISAAAPAADPKVRIIAIPSSYSCELEMNVGDETCIRCKKMTVKIGDNEITVSRFDDRVRVRGEELKATADSVRSDRKDRLILEGDVVLHYKKDGHSANVTGDCIELNLSSGAVTIKPAVRATVHPAVRIDRVDTDK
jgi:hypothetical protein